MRLPNLSAREVRWSFYLVGVCTLALTATICWGIVHKVNQSDEVLHIAASSSAQVDRLGNQLDAQATTADAQRAALQRQNKAVRDELRAARVQLRALLTYLRAHGIAVPSTALALQPHASAVTRPKDVQAPTKPRPVHPASPAPTATPTPPSPTPAPGIPDLCTVLAALCP